MNKWLYLLSSCIFIFLIITAYPFVKTDPTGWNLYLTIIFIACLLLSLYLFIKKVIYKPVQETTIENNFTPVD